MEYLKIRDVRNSVNEGPSGTLDRYLTQYRRQAGLYSQAITRLVAASGPQLELAERAIEEDSRTRVSDPVSRLSAPYFVNEDIIGGVLVGKAVSQVNQEYAGLGLATTDGKVKLGPGVGYVQAPAFYNELLKQGLADPDLAVNYNAPNGERMTRQGLARLVNAKTENAPAYGEFDVFLTSGATEAIDATVATFGRLNPGKGIAVLGPSYYAGLFSSQYRDIPVTQLVADGAPLFPSVREMQKNLPDSTGMILLTMPNNPTGEMYPEQELRDLFAYAKASGKLILFDDIFGRLTFDRQKNPVEIAREAGALDNLVVVDSLSKSLNIPGLRPGVVATTNAPMRAGLSDRLIAAKCNPPLVLGPLLSFEGLARGAEEMMQQDRTASPGKLFDALTQGTSVPFSREWFVRAFDQWQTWNTLTMEYYAQNLSFIRSFLKETGMGKQGSPDQGAFNTLVQLTAPLTGANSLDFLYKLMVGTATYTQTGPCFGLDQDLWDRTLGVWTRITYASDRKSLGEGLVRLASLAKAYDEKDLGNPAKFPSLSVSYASNEQTIQKTN